MIVNSEAFFLCALLIGLMLRDAILSLYGEVFFGPGTAMPRPLSEDF